MGSATREALAASRAKLSSTGTADLATADELFSAGRIIGGSAQLISMLSDTSTDAADKQAILSAVFGSNLSEPTLGLLGTVVSHRWSSTDDLLAGIEELGLRAAADSAPATVNIDAELFAFGTAVSSDSELELAVSSKLGSTESKVALVEALLVGKASPQTLSIVRHLMQQPRGRRIGELLRTAASIVADQSGLAVATITSATAIRAVQLERLQKGLAAKFGQALKFNLVVDPALIGGLRVQVGDRVMDGSVASKLKDLRLQLAR
ncbi:F0F1 ATP synthase subunit delta [Lacisediminihabitans sp.]|jgi:F-type H+-transporting ATPase subunit delta|uniref:F0F1 ATP synthase subunit delta n=1 Tax=Lacisediminihabitans sp. TaxID=2787631 RepID=UPI002F92FF14